MNQKQAKHNQSMNYTTDIGYGSRSKSRSPNCRSTGSAGNHININAGSTTHLKNIAAINTNSQEDIRDSAQIFAASQPYHSSKSKDATHRSIHGELA